MGTQDGRAAKNISIQKLSLSPSPSFPEDHPLYGCDHSYVARQDWDFVVKRGR